MDSFKKPERCSLIKAMHWRNSWLQLFQFFQLFWGFIAGLVQELSFLLKRKKKKESAGIFEVLSKTIFQTMERRYEGLWSFCPFLYLKKHWGLKEKWSGSHCWTHFLASVHILVSSISFKTCIWAIISTDLLVRYLLIYCLGAKW